VRRTVIIAIGVFTSLMIAAQGLTAGSDDRGNPNDPRTNERANACFEGGSMAGKCDAVNEWEAGWYLIRFETGLISREQVPAQHRWTVGDAVPGPIATEEV
jgi:hypothetical protein